MAIKWTAKMVETCEEEILAGTPIARIAELIGISEPSFYRHRLDDEEFDRTIARAQEAASEAEIDRTNALAKTATVDNWQLVQFQCRNAQWTAGKRKPKKYGDKVEQFISGPGGGPIQSAISVEFVKTGDSGTAQSKG